MDRSLVVRAQRGDREAYESLARSSARRLYLTAWRIVRDGDVAEDAVQQTLVAMWRDLPSLRDPDRFEAWTYRLVVRACLADARRSRRMGIRRVALDPDLPDRDDGIDQVEVRDQLRRALDGLSLDHRTVVVLHHYAGLPIADIAEILGVPYGTVGSRLHYAIQALRAAVAADDRGMVLGGRPA